MGGDQQHACADTAFRPFPDSALEGSLVDRFTKQVRRHRDCVALVDGTQRLTYGDLDRWSNGVADEIAGSAGAGRDPVALLVEQGAGYAAAVLGALKTGRPYVALETSDPAVRLRTFVRECGAVAVLCERTHRALAADLAGSLPVVCVDEAERSPAPPPVDPPGPDSIAYIFFTSGTTGAPKGVFDSHRNVLHNVLRYTNALSLAPSDRLTLLQGPAFSGCVSSQFGALLNGGASFPFRLAEQGLVRAAAWLARERITVYHSVPSIFRAIVAHTDVLEDIRVVRLEGDRATAADVELWRAHTASTCVLANGLGTTETGLARQLLLRHEDPAGAGLLPVGHAVRDMDVLLVDEDRQPVPHGAVGEIAVASAYLALGYWRQPHLTADRFESRAGGRMYFTGDLGRLTTGGCLEYLGRREGDLKVLGTRVEPAEVERELLRVDGVRDAAVAVDPGIRGDGRVVAYVVPSASPAPELAAVRAALGESLPAAMLPTSLVVLESLPSGVNGKVDRSALPEPPRPVATEGPVSARQEWLVDVWRDVLGVDALGPNDDFFAFGGDSLAAAEIVARIEGETGRALPLSALVTHPTVSELALVMDGATSTGVSSLTALRWGDQRPSLVLVHGNTGNALHFANLVQHVDGARPVLALEYLDRRADLRVDSIVTAHHETLTLAEPSGPYLVTGFCYGGVIAHELGRRLARDHGDAHVALLGITPLEFPTVVSPKAYERWRIVMGPPPSVLDRLRYHSRVAARLPRGQRTTYLADRARNVAHRSLSGILDSVGPRPESSVSRAAQEALAAHRPQPFPGRPLVVLHEEDTALYSTDPEEDWAGLGSEGIELVVLPGSDHAMLEPTGVDGLAAVLRRWASGVAAAPAAL